LLDSIKGLNYQMIAGFYCMDGRTSPFSKLSQFIQVWRSGCMPLDSLSMTDDVDDNLKMAGKAPELPTRRKKGLISKLASPIHQP
jgi:hypothetical protein